MYNSYIQVCLCLELQHLSWSICELRLESLWLVVMNVW